MGKPEEDSGRAFGDLLGDHEYMAAQKAKLDAAASAPPEETAPLDRSVALRGLANITGVDPEKVARDYGKCGAALRTVLDRMFNLGSGLITR